MARLRPQMSDEAFVQDPVTVRMRPGGRPQLLPTAGDTQEAAAMSLLIFMSGISEEYWSSGWLNNLEYSLWAVRQSGPNSYFPITGEEALLLRALSRECDGWWMQPLQDGGEWFLEFISLADWEEHIKRAWVGGGGFFAEGVDATVVPIATKDVEKAKRRARRRIRWRKIDQFMAPGGIAVVVCPIPYPFLKQLFGASLRDGVLLTVALIFCAASGWGLRAVSNNRKLRGFVTVSIIVHSFVALALAALYLGWR